MKKFLISILTPVYNEEDNIYHIYEQVKKEMLKLEKKYDYEHIFSDNSSIDNSLSILKDIHSKDSKVKIFTAKDPEGLDAIRHDTTHIMAMAVQELFPGTKLAIGPAIKDGFYYDFYREEPFTPKDLEKIEIKMKEIT